MVVEYKTLLNIIRINPNLTDVAASYVINNKLPGWQEIASVRSKCLYINPIESGYKENVEDILRSNNTIG